MKTDNRRVLIIDDERPVLMTLEALLNRRGYHVDTAGTASQGVKLLKSNLPSLVLRNICASSILASGVVFPARYTASRR